MTRYAPHFVNFHIRCIVRNGIPWHHVAPPARPLNCLRKSRHESAIDYAAARAFTHGCYRRRNAALDGTDNETGKYQRCAREAGFTIGTLYPPRERPKIFRYPVCRTLILREQRCRGEGSKFTRSWPDEANRPVPYITTEMHRQRDKDRAVARRTLIEHASPSVGRRWYFFVRGARYLGNVYRQSERENE